MSRILWIVYGSIMTAFSAIGLYTAFASNTLLFPTILSSIFTIVYLTGLFGFVTNKAIWTRRGWRFLFWLNIVAHSLRLLTLLLVPYTSVQIIDILFSIVFSLPILYALYKYSSVNNEAWGEARISSLVTYISNMLANNDVLESSVTTHKESGELKTTVRLLQDNEEFVVKIVKNENDNEQSFSNSFNKLSDAIRFLERNTAVRAGDFA